MRFFIILLATVSDLPDISQHIYISLLNSWIKDKTLMHLNNHLYTQGFLI